MQEFLLHIRREVIGIVCNERNNSLHKVFIDKWISITFLLQINQLTN